MSKEKDEKSINAFSFMIEALQKPKCQFEFIVRTQLPNGSVGVVCMGDEKELIEFLHSL